MLWVSLRLQECPIRVQVWYRKTCGVELNPETSTTQLDDQGGLLSNYCRSISVLVNNSSLFRVFFFSTIIPWSFVCFGHFCWKALKINLVDVVSIFSLKDYDYQSIHQLIHPFKSMFCICFLQMSCCQILQLPLSLSLLLYFLANVRCFQFYEGLFVWKNSNQSVSPWKQAVKLDMATTTKQVKSYLQSKGRNSGRGCISQKEPL